MVNVMDKFHLIIQNITGNPNQVIQQWTNGANNGDLCLSTYSCTFTDINGCMTTLNNIIVLEADPIVVTSIQKLQHAYNNGDDGEVQVIAAGGANPISYQWYGIQDLHLLQDGF